MADDDRSHSECEDVNLNQWDLVSVSGFSEHDSEQNVSLEHVLVEAEVDFEHFDCPPSPILSDCPPPPSLLSSPPPHKLNNPPIAEPLFLEQPCLTTTEFCDPEELVVAEKPSEPAEVEAVTAGTVLEATISDAGVDPLRDLDADTGVYPQRDFDAETVLEAKPAPSFFDSEPMIDAGVSEHADVVLEATVAEAAVDPEGFLVVDTVSEARTAQIEVDVVKEDVAEQQGVIERVMDPNSYVGSTVLGGFKQAEQFKEIDEVGSLLDREFETWWRDEICLRRAQVRQANGFWSVALAASLIGLVILGRKLHHERCQNQQLRLQLSARDEKVNQLLMQVSRLRRSFMSRRRLQVHRGRTCYHGFADCF